MGDTLLIPVGHGQTIRNSDGFYTYFYTGDNNQQSIYHYSIKNGHIYAELDNNNYLIYDLSTKGLMKFPGKSEYEDYAKTKDFPSTEEFKDFFEHYKNHWGGWRSVLLP